MSNGTPPPLPPPTPNDGQSYPRFPDSWYADATPDEPFYIAPPPNIPAPGQPVYTPPPYSPPPQHTGQFQLMVQPYDLGSPDFGSAIKFGTHYMYSLGALDFARPKLTVH
jgi:hypothetical protein